MDLFLVTIDRLRRALPQANQTGLALIRLDEVRDQLLAAQRRAPLLMDVGLVLVPEVAHGAQERVGGALAQGAQGGLDGDLGELLQGLDVVQHAGLVPEALDVGVDVLRLGLSDPTFQGRHQRRGFATNEDAGPLVHLDHEVEARAEDVLAQEAVCISRPDPKGQVRPDSFRFEAIPLIWVPFLPSALLPFLRSLSIGPFQRIFGLFLLDFLNSGILFLSC